MISDSFRFKWMSLSFIGCLVLMIIFQFYLYQTSFTFTHFINDLFLAGLVFVAIGGLFYVIQSGFFDVPMYTIAKFWKGVTNIGRWVEENEFEEDEKPIYDHEKRKRRHPFPLSSVVVGLLFCIISFILSSWV